MIIQKLLLIESDARNAMQILEKEQAEISAKTEAEVAQRVAEMENAKNLALQEHIEATNDKTLSAIAKLTAEYKQKGSELIKIYTANRSLWEEKIFNDVLHGQS